MAFTSFVVFSCRHLGSMGWINGGLKTVCIARLKVLVDNNEQSAPGVNTEMNFFP